jgi:hypothetical protein
VWGIATNLEFQYGASSERLSSFYYDDDSKFNGSDVIFDGGYDALFTQIVGNKSINIIYGANATSIVYDDATGAQVYVNVAEHIARNATDDVVARPHAAQVDAEPAVALADGHERGGRPREAGRPRADNQHIGSWCHVKGFQAMLCGSLAQN